MLVCHRQLCQRAIKRRPRHPKIFGHHTNFDFCRKQRLSRLKLGCIQLWLAPTKSTTGPSGSADIEKTFDQIDAAVGYLYEFDTYALPLADLADRTGLAFPGLVDASGDDARAPHDRPVDAMPGDGPRLVRSALDVEW